MPRIQDVRAKKAPIELQIRCPHEASLRLGDRVIFQAASSTTRPKHYYNFATYAQLVSRKPNPKPLTDYIGRIEKISPILERAGKRIRKTTILDEMSNLIEITFWSEKMFSYEKEEPRGKLLAVTSTIVTEYQQRLQLESTPATVVVVNPHIPELPEYINKFAQITRSGTSTTEDSIIAISDIFNKYNEDNTKSRFTCRASVTEITSNRKWYYVTCPNCPKKLFLEDGDVPKFVCKDDGITLEPTFMYCVNTTIADESSNAKAVFFNEAMAEILETTCRDMVVLHGHTDPGIIPAEIYAIRGKTAILNISMKKNRTLSVNKATLASFTPTTPSMNVKTRKRKQTQASAEKSKSKHQKP